MIGFGDKLGGTVDTLLARMGNEGAQRRLDAMNGIMSPEAERTAAQARKRRAERTAAAQSSDASTSAAATSDTTPVEAGMSEADLAKLSQGERTNYYLSELLKSNRKLARNLSGDVFAQ